MPSAAPEAAPEGFETYRGLASWLGRGFEGLPRALVGFGAYCRILDNRLYHGPIFPI